MRSWDALPEHRLRPAGPISAPFLARGITDYRNAALARRNLVYGRNAVPEDPLAVLRENRGTCSTKHALLARLAGEQELAVELMVGIYEMDGENTPGISEVLEHYGIERIPEAHCYLRFNCERIDVTRTVVGKPVSAWLFEQVISPDQIGAYKVALHQRFMREWIATASHPYTFPKLWQAREACIEALGQTARG
jgi:hypothetical protein